MNKQVVPHVTVNENMDPISGGGQWSTRGTQRTDKGRIDMQFVRDTSRQLNSSSAT